MSNKRTNYIVIIIFLIFIYAPLILSKFITIDNKNLENRNLAVKPHLDLKNINSIVEYPTKFNDYWNDNLPFRNKIRQLNSNIDYVIFNTSPSINVILGKKDDKGNRWLFYNQLEKDNPIGDVTGTKKISKNEMKKIYKKVNKNKEILNDKEIYYVVIPNKSTVYSNYLPNSIISKNNTMSSQIDKKLQKKDINSIYLLDLLKEKTKEKDTYYHLDTHWNNYGAFVASDYIIKEIDNNFDKYDNYKLKKENMDNFLGDLYKLINTNIKMNDIEEKVIIKYDNELVSKSIGEYTHNIFITENDNPYIDKKVLILGDSFRYEMIPFLSHAFRNVVSMHRDKYEYSMIDEYDPDIILIIGVERFSKSIYNFDLSRNKNVIK